MKIPIVLFLVCVSHFLFGQDTILWQQRQYSGKEVRVINGADTSIVGYYKNGKLESVRSFKKNRYTGTYDRYYPNGKKMWTKELINDVENGTSVFYNKSGEKVAELVYKNGILTDTVFLSSKETVLLGKATWFSVVHGGMYREDNIPVEMPSNNPYSNYPFTLVKIMDSKSIPKAYQKFETDSYGNFLLCLPKGEYGFFPMHNPLKNLSPGQYCPLPQRGNSSESNWNMTAPLKIENPSLLYFHLHFNSEAWAP